MMHDVLVDAGVGPATRRRADRRILAWCAFAGAVAVSAQCLAQNAPAPPSKDAVHLSGCPVRLDANCVMMRDRRGTPYDITSVLRPAGTKGRRAASPDLSRHLGLELDGVVAEGEVGACRRGVALREVRWRYTKEKCPSAPARD